MSESLGVDIHAAVFVQGDGEPFVTELTVEQVAAAILDATCVEDAFIRLPHPTRPDALVRPRAIVAISPFVDGDDDLIGDE
jgi:hypothetical protein